MNDGKKWEDEGNDQDPRRCGPRSGLRLPLWTLLALSVFFIVLWLVLSGCTFIGFNKGPVSTVEKDSHNASGTNRVSTFDVNISPR